MQEIPYLMGHTALEMTLQIYTHYNKKSRYADNAVRIRAVI